MSLSQFASRPEAQTEGALCVRCATTRSNLEISHQRWETMGSKNAFGHLWNHMLPRGLVFARAVHHGDALVLIEPIPRYIHIASVQGVYTPTHSRCYRTARTAWVQQQQASCQHAPMRGRPWMRQCPDCRARL